MLKSEMFSWPVTLAILVLAFGALVAAGLPLILTLAGPGRLGRLAGADQPRRAGLDLGDELRDDVRPRARHRLRPVPRGPLPRRPDGPPRERRAQAVAETMDTAGKAVLLSGATVLISLSAVMLVPSPSFRSMAGGIMLSVVFVLGRHADPAAAGAVQARRTDQQALAALGRTPASTARAKFAAWGERLWKRPLVVGPGLARRAARARRARARPEDRDALDQGAARRTPRARVGYDQVQDAFGDGAPGTLQVVVDTRRRRRPPPVLAERRRASPAPCPPMPATDGSRPRR